MPNPPDKGEKIRAHHELLMCVRHWPVHLACFARSDRELEDAVALRSVCASVYVERIVNPISLSRAALGFAAGHSLTLEFYSSARMRGYVDKFAARAPLFAAMAYTSAMVQYVPKGLPFVLDMVDADSEKWMQFAESRRPRWFYRTEGERLRKEEAAQLPRAERTFVTTDREARVLSGVTPAPAAEIMGNGVDANYFNPELFSATQETGGAAVFLGAMNYYPNVDAVLWFAKNVFPQWKRREPRASFYIVGRNPTSEVRQLARIDGIHVVGAVDDVRPYLASAQVVVAPLRIAQGIQNKVLEALAMGKPVIVSPQVAECLGAQLPAGVFRCECVEEYLDALTTFQTATRAWDPGIRSAARSRFSWDANLKHLYAAIEPLARAPILAGASTHG